MFFFSVIGAILYKCDMLMMMMMIMMIMTWWDGFKEDARRQRGKEETGSQVRLKE